MRRSLGWIFVLLVVAWTTTADDGWTRYAAPDYGFSMLVPSGTEIKERTWSGGWGGLYAEHEGVKLYAVVLLDDDASAEEIEKVGVQVTGIGADSWTMIDNGKNVSGWKWYRTVKAKSGGMVAYGGYGVGEKGSYLLLLLTTAEDYALYQDDYDHWYESVRLE